MEEDLTESVEVDDDKKDKEQEESFYKWLFKFHNKYTTLTLLFALYFVSRSEFPTRVGHAFSFTAKDKIETSE